jgi:hypothetical protein
VRVILARDHLLATFKHFWRSSKRDFNSSPPLNQWYLFFLNPFACQIDVTETAASIGILIQARTEELEMAILDLQNDVVLKSYATHKNV